MHFQSRELKKPFKWLLFQRFPKVPKGAPEFVRGVINLRGSVVRVIDPRIIFGFSPCEIKLDMNLLIIKMRFNPIALIVDEVIDVVDIQNKNIEEAVVVGDLSDYISSVAKYNKKLVYILDIIKMFTDDEKLFIENKSR